MAELNLSALQRIEALVKRDGGALPEPIQAARAERIAIVKASEEAPSLEAELQAALSGMASGTDASKAKAYASYLSAYASHETRAKARTRLQKAAEARVVDVARQHTGEIVAAIAASGKVKAAAADLNEYASRVPAVPDAGMLSRSADEVISWKKCSEAVNVAKLIANHAGALYSFGDWSGDKRALLLFHALPELQSYGAVDTYLRALGGVESTAGATGVGDGSANRAVSPVPLLVKAGVTSWGLQAPVDVSRAVQRLEQMRHASYWRDSDAA